MPKKLQKVFNSCMVSDWANKQAKGDPKKKNQICRATAVKVTGQKWIRHKNSNSDGNWEWMEEGLIDVSMNIENLELSESGSMFLYGTAITSEFIPKEDIMKYHASMRGTKLLFDHWHPVGKGPIIDGKERRFPVFGYIRDTSVVNLENDEIGVRVKAEILGFSQAHKNLQGIVQQKHESGEDLSFSEHVFRYLNKNKETTHVHWEETSVTPAPICKKCRIDRIEKGDIMTGDIKAPEVEATQTKLGGSGTERDTTGLTPTPTELTEEQKLAKARKVEELEATIVSLDEKIVKLSKRVEELIPLEAEIASKNDAIKELQNKLSERVERVAFLEHKAPLLNEIAQKLGGKYKENQKLQEHYAKLPVEILEMEVKRLSEEQKQIQVATPPVKNEIKPGEIKSDELKMKELFPDHFRNLENAKLESINKRS